mmetsp:Transcript_162704/g.312419  ORF Transcript_162704/g.312419 Transcript_162704/m.312419 type:complete len:202 (-) Transcript_162704:168-773(-)
MAINPVLAADQDTGELFPLPQAGENFLLKRDGISFTGKLPGGGSLSGKGMFFMSSSRIVFLANKKSSRPDFKSFEIPFKMIEKSQFKQPIFSANYLHTAVRPASADAGPLAGGTTTANLYFKNGGCGTFLPLFYTILGIISESEEGTDRDAEANAAVNNYISAAAAGQLDKAAYVDPSDPTVLYLAQPTAKAGSEEKVTFG